MSVETTTVERSNDTHKEAILSLHEAPLAFPSKTDDASPPQADFEAVPKGNKAPNEGGKTTAGRQRVPSLQVLWKRHFPRKTAKTTAAVTAASAEQHHAQKHKPHPSRTSVPPEHGVLVHNHDARGRRSVEERRTRRVSFSPSTGEEEVKAIDGSLNLTTEGGGVQVKKSGNDHGAKRRASFDGLRAIVVHTPGKSWEPRRRVRSFSFDRSGVHLGVAALEKPSAETFDKGLPTRPRLTKQQVVAARHARTLEQIMLGNGRSDKSAHANKVGGSEIGGNKAADKSSAKKGSKTDSTKSRPIPMASAKKVRALKRALLDADTANDIIVQLRAMPQSSAVEASSSHKERIISEPVEEDQTSKNDSKMAATSEIGERSAASPAEKALHEIHRAQSAVVVVESRKSSLPSNSEKKKTTTTDAYIIQDMRPRGPIKAVSLDCDEAEACRRHARHVANLEHPNLSKGGSEEGKEEQVSAATIVAATGTGAVLFSLGYWLKKRVPEVVPIGKAAKFSEEIVDDIKTGDTAETIKDSVRLGVAGLEIVQPLAGKAAASVQDCILGKNKQVTTVSEGEDKVTGDLGEQKEPTGNEKEVKEEQQETAASVQTLVAIPSDGGPFAGVNPISLITSPSTTIASAAAQQAGAFDTMGALSGQVIQSAAGGQQAMLEIHPPLDRLAIFVHWWGFELTMPRPTMNYLSTAHSISGAFMSFLQTMVVSGGVPELHPFVRYISQYMDMEFAAVKSQDRGNGVIVAATWLM